MNATELNVDVSSEGARALPISIVDIIDHSNKHFTQRMLVVDRMPRFIYQRRGDTLIGHDSGFFKFFGYGRPGPNWQAFGGAKFQIPMADGSVIEADGQWWDVCPKDFSEVTYGLGVSTIAELEKCHVFTGGIHVDRELVDAWLQTNAPSNNYHKYDRRSESFGKQTIVSPWD